MYDKMFDQEALDKVQEANKQEQKKLKQTRIPTGFQMLILESVELTQSKKLQPMFVVTARKADDKDEKFKPVAEYFVVDENGLKNKDGLNLNLYNFLSFFINSFKFVPKDIDKDDPLGDLQKKVSKYAGKEFRGMIMWEESLNDKGTVKYTTHKLYTKKCGHVSDTTINEQSIPKTIKKLEPRQQAILDGKIIPDAPGKKGGNDSHGTPKVDDDPGDDLPF